MPLAAVLAGSYLVGAIPFGYLLGRAYGVDLFKVGSGNIGATNLARAVGTVPGVVCFALDFLKGAGPVLAADAVGGSPAVRVAAAALAFAGHLFPVYLGFRGGKGVATGAGAMAVLVPGPTAVAVLFWACGTAAGRRVSVGSVAAVAALSAARLAGTPAPFAGDHLPVTAFVLAASAAAVVKHRSNLRRLAAGTEPGFADRPARHTFLKAAHLLAVGLWFGGAGFFSFGTAVPVFASFRRVVSDGPSDRTAYEAILPPDASDERKAALASALAGAAVGPVFPRLFAVQAVCGGVAVVTALAWWHSESGRRAHRLRVGVLAAGLAVVAVGGPISEHVSELRLARFSPDPAVAAAAKAGFGPWHLASLALSGVAVGLAGAGLALGAKLPPDPPAEPKADPAA